MIVFLLEVDLVQAEWVVTAYYSRDAQMIEVVREGLDPHLRTGHLISGAPEDLIKAEADIVGHFTDPETIQDLRAKEIPDVFRFFCPRTMSIRQAGKKSNHGFNYGLGPNTFSLMNGMEQKEGKVCFEKYHKAYPGLRSMYAAIAEKLSKDRTLENCFGDKRRFLDRWGTEMLKAAYSFVPQSTVARVTNNGLCNAFEDDSLWTFDIEKVCDPRAQVHDSVLFHVTCNTWVQAATIVRTLQKHFTMPCSYHGEEFTLKLDFKVGVNWGAMQELRLMANEDFNAATVRSAYLRSLQYVKEGN